jgi:hypothetical protein
MHLGMLGGRRVASAQRRRQSHSQVMVNSVNGRVRIYQTRMVRTYASNGRRIREQCTNRHTRNRCRNSNSKVVVYLGIDCGRICSTRKSALIPVNKTAWKIESTMGIPETEAARAVAMSRTSLGSEAFASAQHDRSRGSGGIVGTGGIKKLLSTKKHNGHTRNRSCQSNSHVTGFFELGCVRICTTRKVGQTTRRGVDTPMDKPSTDAARATARSLSS